MYEPLENLFAERQRALPHAPADILLHSRPQVLVVVHDESLHGRTGPDDQAGVRTGRRGLLVVLFHKSAQCHPRVRRQPLHDGMEDRPANVVEIHVDAVRTERAQSVANGSVAVDTAVETRLVDQPRALLRAARYADDPGTGGFAKLSHRRPDGARGG